MRKLVSRAYIMEVMILTLTPFFYVHKGTEDIQMVFDAMVSGFNDLIWDTNFMLPSMGSFLRDGAYEDAHGKSRRWGNVL